MLRAVRGLTVFLLLLIIPFWFFYTGGYGEIEEILTSNPDGGRLKLLKETITSRIPGQDQFRRLQVEMNYWAGSKEQNGVFIGDNMLMRNLQPPDSKIVEANTSAITEIARRIDRPSYLMLIPTACAVQQRKVPYNSVTPLYNQRELIDQIYQQMAGNVTAIDVYPTLFNHQDEYIYYRTDSTPTGMGGYYIYTAAAKKLGIVTLRGIEQFSVDHIDYSFLGDLYESAPYYAVEPDRISVYKYERGAQSYTMTHFDETGSYKYFSLYPYSQKTLGNSKDIILGGVSPIVTVEITYAQSRRKLLVLGDSTMQSYLPFFLSHYSKVTFVDTAKASTKVLENLSLQEYNQVLFAYSTEQFISQPQLIQTLALCIQQIAE